mmetsp:Transcript_136174/g.379613  ORF Transcript_136174/g.379613 Transcript_136174/m.379613 type:complete len:277 (-) Transcript_136174:479-1309(-)
MPKDVHIPLRPPGQTRKASVARAVSTSKRWESQRWRCAAMCAPSRQKAKGVERTQRQSVKAGTVVSTRKSRVKKVRPPHAMQVPRVPEVTMAPQAPRSSNNRKVRVAPWRSPHCSALGRKAWAVWDKDSEASKPKAQKIDFVIWWAAASTTPRLLAAMFRNCTVATLSAKVRHTGKAKATKDNTSLTGAGWNPRMSWRCLSIKRATKHPAACATTVVNAAPAIPSDGHIRASPTAFITDCPRTMRSPVRESRTARSPALATRYTKSKGRPTARMLA